MPINIYFAGAIKGDSRFASAQQNIIDILRGDNGTGINVHVYSERSPDIFDPFKGEEDEREVFFRDLEWLFQSDAIVAEVTGESFGTGWEIAYAQKVRRKPVLCLVQDEMAFPSLISGNTHKNMYIGRYNGLETIREICQEFISLVVEEAKSVKGESIRSAPIKLAEKTPSRKELWAGSIENYDINLVSISNPNHSVSSGTNEECISALSNAEVISEENDSVIMFFQELSNALSTSQFGVFMAEGSEPSTDLGWATCFAQWNNVQPLIYYRESEDVSWLLTGQAAHVKNKNLITTDSDLPWTFKPREAPHYSTRPCAVPIAYSNPDKLISKIKELVGNLHERYQEKETADFKQENLWEYSSSHDAETPPANVILAEAAIRNILWLEISKTGFDQTFLSGDRGLIIQLLLEHEPVPSPKEYYKLIRHRVYFEEKAFAKNIRALKDIGVLYKGNKEVLKFPTGIQKTFDEFDEFGSVPEGEPSKAYQTSFAEERLVLTKFGRHLARFLVENSKEEQGVKMVDLEAFLRECSDSIEKRYEVELADYAGRGDGYMLEEFPKRLQEDVIGMVNNKFWYLNYLPISNN